MATSHQQQTETVQPEADEEQWVLLQHDADAVNEQLVEEQDGGARGEKESIPNVAEGRQLSAHDLEKLLRWCRSGAHDASGVKEIIRNAAERLDSAEGTDRFLWWWHAAWNDAFVRKALWEDIRLYVFVAALSAYVVLHVLATLAPLTEYNTLQALLICLKHFTTATLKAATFSIGTRFLSLSAVKASVVDKTWHAFIVMCPHLTNVTILQAACYACIREMGAGITLFQEVRREENLEWFLQLLADMARVHVLTAAIALCASLVFLMWTDVNVPLWASTLHNMVMADYRKLAASRRLKGQAEHIPSLCLIIVTIPVCITCGIGITTLFICLSCILRIALLDLFARAATSPI